MHDRTGAETFKYRPGLDPCMGRIKTKLVKRISFDLLEHHKDKLSTSFEENKTFITELLDDPNKKIRNSVAGYVTRLMKSA